MEEPFVIGGMTLATEVTAADWVVAGVRNFEYDVGSLMPPDFDAYARIFHPARLWSGDERKDVRWGQVAQANSRHAHASMQWASITGSWQFEMGDHQPGLWDELPDEGSLPVQQTSMLATVLAQHTKSPGNAGSRSMRVMALWPCPCGTRPGSGCRTARWCCCTERCPR